MRFVKNDGGRKTASYTVRISTVARPYTLTFTSGHSYSLTSEEAQGLLDNYPAHTATKNRVVLVGHNSAAAHDRTVLRPATLGGGPAFIIERD